MATNTLVYFYNSNAKRYDILGDQQLYTDKLRKLKGCCKNTSKKDCWYYRNPDGSIGDNKIIEFAQNFNIAIFRDNNPPPPPKRIRNRAKVVVAKVESESESESESETESESEVEKEKEVQSEVESEKEVESEVEKDKYKNSPLSRNKLFSDVKINYRDYGRKHFPEYKYDYDYSSNEDSGSDSYSENSNSENYPTAPQNLSKLN